MYIRVHRAIIDAEIARIVRSYQAWRGGDLLSGDIPKLCKSAITDEIKGHGFVFTPGRFVGDEAVKDDGETFEEKMQRLTATLHQQMEEGVRLDAAIRRNLKGSGFGAQEVTVDSDRQCRFTSPTDRWRFSANFGSLRPDAE